MELVVTPMIFGFFGWLLDRWLGTWPVFTLVFWAVVLACIVWKQTKLYGAAMTEEQRRILGEKPEAS
jgi:F0F1-type ATP synthase assembly protein I